MLVSPHLTGQERLGQAGRLCAQQAAHHPRPLLLVPILGDTLWRWHDVALRQLAGVALGLAHVTRLWDRRHAWRLGQGPGAVSWTSGQSRALAAAQGWASAHSAHPPGRDRHSPRVKAANSLPGSGSMPGQQRLRLGTLIREALAHLGARRGGGHELSCPQRCCGSSVDVSGKVLAVA